MLIIKERKGSFFCVTYAPDGKTALDLPNPRQTFFLVERPSCFVHCFRRRLDDQACHLRRRSRTGGR
jgi:hypothetical protein